MRPPSVDALARSLADTGLPHPLLVDAARKAIADGDLEVVEKRARSHAHAAARSLLHPVVNATGVLLHTNLGRAPLAVSADAAYSNLELDLSSGRRGSRHAHAAALLARLCDAEDAIVVNNGASAVLLVLAALSTGRGAAVSRGELVEIGGGFRVPEVMEQSGAILVEVGTTNRTRLADFASAAENPANDTALALKVHQSNYRIVGFTEHVTVAEMASLDVPVVADIGSGLVDAACPWLAHGPPAWLAGEPAARQSLADGAALVTFSGDKLFGGPQAGIIAGRADLVQRCGRHPLARALRPGSLVLNALQQVTLAYLRRDGEAIEFWRMASLATADLEDRAQSAVAESGVGDVAHMASVPGGGTLPGTEIDSCGVVLDGDQTGSLRAGSPPIIARVSDNRTWLDLRTVAPGDDRHVIAALKALG
ncbi:L-seryl-tRNA(Sec) selenium transferase [Candidatus Poriferisocius sp.]|uniref:L-seryl-tRNA(Sec) selenium transferase n=1 Tax=Candidatus Poriferisocius sp. TaxID=3101276 RepID=UPI003B516726